MLKQLALTALTGIALVSASVPANAQAIIIHPPAFAKSHSNVYVLNATGRQTVPVVQTQNYGWAVICKPQFAYSPMPLPLCQTIPNQPHTDYTTWTNTLKTMFKDWDTKCVKGQINCAAQWLI